MSDGRSRRVLMRISAVSLTLALLYALLPMDPLIALPLMFAAAASAAMGSMGLSSILITAYPLVYSLSLGPASLLMIPLLLLSILLVDPWCTSVAVISFLLQFTQFDWLSVPTSLIPRFLCGIKSQAQYLLLVVSYVLLMNEWIPMMRLSRSPVLGFGWILSPDPSMIHIPMGTLLNPYLYLFILVYMASPYLVDRFISILSLRFKSAHLASIPLTYLILYVPSLVTNGYSLGTLGILGSVMAAPALLVNTRAKANIGRRGARKLVTTRNLVKLKDSLLDLDETTRSILNELREAAARGPVLALVDDAENLGTLLFGFMGMRGILVGDDDLDESLIDELESLRRSFKEILLVAIIRNPDPSMVRRISSRGGLVVCLTDDEDTFSKYGKYFKERRSLIKQTQRTSAPIRGENLDTTHGNTPGEAWRNIEVGLDDIQELIDESIKSRLVDYVDSSLRLRDMLTSLGISPVNSILLVGPSGVGKSALVRYVADRVGARLTTPDSPQRDTIVHIPNLGVLDDYGILESPGYVIIAESNTPWELSGELLGRFDRVIYVPPPFPRIIEAALTRYVSDAGLRRSIAEKLGGCGVVEVAKAIKYIAQGGSVDHINCTKLSVDKYLDFLRSVN